MARKRAINGPETGGNTADLGLEAKLRPTAEQAAPALHIEAPAENTGARPEGLLGFIFLKYISDSYDPACGSGGMFAPRSLPSGSARKLTCAGAHRSVQSEKFVETHGGSLGDISIYGQESNATTRRLAIMNLAIRGIEADIGKEHADTFRNVQHPDLRADYVLANPPFNDSDWFRKDDDVRWQFGVPPKGNANFAWVQHFIHHLAPGGAGTSGGMAGFVLANGSMSSNQSGEGDICRALIKHYLVGCMFALPGELFYSTQIPVYLWFWGKNNTLDSANDARLFDGETELSLVA